MTAGADPGAANATATSGITSTSTINHTGPGQEQDFRNAGLMSSYREFRLLAPAGWVGPRNDINEPADTPRLDQQEL